MKYCLASEKDVATCNNLKKDVIARLNSLNLPLWNEEYPSDELIKEDIESGRGRIILNEENEIIAYVSVMPANEEFEENTFNYPHLLALSRLMVKSGYENQGVATYLINQIINEAKTKGYNGIGILVHPINERAIKLYKKIGFKFEQRKQYLFGEYDSYSYLFLK